MTDEFDVESPSEPEPVKDDKPWRVLATDGRRVYFEGPEKEARKHVENNYPRVHVEPGSVYGDEGPPPDVHLASSSGSKEYWNGEEWSDVKE
jgi:hypothetical protein